MEHPGLRVLGGQPLLERLVTLGKPAPGGVLAGLGACGQLPPPLLELGLGLAAALLETRLDQDVVDDPRDAQPQRPLDVPGVENDLEVGPQALQVVGVDLRGGLVLQQEMLVADPDDPVHPAGQHEAPG